MPAVNEQSLILLTGASGFLAAHCGQQLIQRGFRVRGTVRSAAKGEYLKKLYDSPNFSYVLVEDVETEGAFDAAVLGVHGILHTASPFHFRVDDPYTDLINPAVQGTLNLIKSAAKESKVGRVVITSSFAAIVNPNPPVYSFTEADWNTFSLSEVETKGKACDPFHAYRASKTLAEKAAWNWLKENTKDGVAPFDIATINPPLIFGPIIHECTESGINTSIAAFYAYLTGAKKDEDATAASGSYVDVRDVAQLHIDALVTPDAGNKRFSVSNAAFSYQPFLDILHAPEHKALLAQFPKAVRGVPGSPDPKQNVIDTTRARTTFNWTPISTEKTVIDMAQSLAERQKTW